jgi:hypothetical protein
MHDHPIAEKTNNKPNLSQKRLKLFPLFFSFPLSVLQNPPNSLFFFFFLVYLGFTKESNTTTGEIDTLADSSLLD